MDKATWLAARERILTGQLLPDQDLPLFYEMFQLGSRDHQKYKNTDLTTFSDNFIRWFQTPLHFKNGMIVSTTQQNIINKLLAFFDAKFQIVYLFAKDGNLIKVF